MRWALIVGLLALACGSEDAGAGSAGSGGVAATGGLGGIAGGAGAAGSGASAGTAGVGGSGGSAGGAAIWPEGHSYEIQSGKTVVEVHVNGQGPIRVVYDTGAPTSGFEPSVLSGFGGPPYQFDIAGQTASVPNLAAYSAAQLGLSGVDGIIGTDVVGSFAVTLDAARTRFWLDTARDEAALLACDHVAAQPHEVPWLQQAYFFVPGSAEGLTGWFLVDTGASLGAMPGGIFDQLNSAAPRPALTGFYTQAGIGTFWSKLTTVGSLEVDGLAVKHLLTRTIADGAIPLPSFSDQKPFLGVLPSDYLSHFLLTMDHPAGVMRLDGYAGDDFTEPSHYFPLGIGLSEQVNPPVTITTVLDGSSAKEQGIQVGDELIKVGSYEMAQLSPAQRGWAVVLPKAKMNVPVVVKQNGTLTTLQLESRDLLKSP